MKSPRPWAIHVVSLVALLLVAWAYWPGLAGPFLFDDYGNLDVLGAFGRLDRWPAILFYLTSGDADPIGRPVALLSFLLDARHWPNEPWAFKRTNLVLHLVNTALLAYTTTRLQAGLRRRRPDIVISPWTPLLAALLWGAHPFFVSTTLYVVQREAMLPLTFVLLSLLVWDRAVLAFELQRWGTGWLWAIPGFGIATLLAGLSKANGFLAPLLAGLAYIILLRSNEDTATRRRSDTAALLCLGLPSLVVLAYLGQVAWQLWPQPQLPGRDWSVAERVLSEPRALLIYLWHLVLPRAGGGGLFVEDFAASRGWFDPVTTLPALLALFAAAAGAIVWRTRLPILAFAVLFFLAAHLLESSVVPLELYFEHRNYLPAAFLGWPLAHKLLHPGAYRNYRAASAALLLTMLLLLTHLRAEVWGNAALLGALSAAHEPNSARSQVAAARQEIDRGDPLAGLARIRIAQRAQPQSIDIAISAIGVECAVTGSLPTDTLARTRQTLVMAKNWNYGLYHWLQDAANDKGMRRCHGFGLAGLTSLVTSAAAGPQSAAPTRKRDLLHVRGRIALAEGRPDIALQWFDAALLTKPDPEYALDQAATLGEAGAPALGIQHLDRYEKIAALQPPVRVRDMPTAHEWLLRYYDYYPKQLSYLRGRLLADADGAGHVKTQL